MKPPLAEVPPVPPPIEDKTPPAPLKILIWVSAVLSMAQWAVDYGTKDFAGHAVYAFTSTVVALLWLNLWRGRAWARYTTCIVYVLGLSLSFIFPIEQTSIESILYTLDTIFSVALVIYLLTPNMRRYFHSP